MAYTVEKNYVIGDYDVFHHDTRTKKVTRIKSCATEEEAMNFMHGCIALEAQEAAQQAPQKQSFDARDNSHLSEDEPTEDPQVKFIRSIKVLRRALIAEVRPGEEEVANAVIDVAAMFVCSVFEQGQHLNRIAHAMEAQTKVLCAAYNAQAESNEAAQG